MERIFNWLSVAAGIIGGMCAGILGGFDSIIAALISLIALDYLTGIIKAISQKKLSSEIGFKGIAKKILILLIFALACAIQNIIDSSIPAREIVIMFYIANEGLSVLENCAELIPVPEKLKSILLQLRNDEIEESEEKK